MNVHAFMNELDQKDPRKIKTCENMYKVNRELSSSDITYSGRVPSREGDIHNFALQSFLLNGLLVSKSAQTFTVGFVKLLSTFYFKVFHKAIAVNEFLF